MTALANATLNVTHRLPAATQPLASATRRLPRHVAVLGAAGGLGQGILEVCRQEGVGFTAIVRPRPERVGSVPSGSRVEQIASLADHDALARAFRGADAVVAALGVTTTSRDLSALLSQNMEAVEDAMWSAGVDRILIMNTILGSQPGQGRSWPMRVLSWVPGTIGRGATEQMAVADELGQGAMASRRWTLVRGALNARGRDAAPVASADWRGAGNSWMPVSYRAMGRWMLEECVADAFVGRAPLVSLARR